MRIPTQLRRSPVGFNMTPMIDVVFLLIIFFLVSSHLARQEAHLELPLPTAESGEEEPTTQHRMTLNVRQDGSILLAGRAVGRHDLADRLRAAQQEQDQLEVRIRSDRRIPYQRVAPIMLACAEAGIWNVSFAVFHPRDVP